MVRDLLSSLSRVIVVNDGSGPQYHATFRACAAAGALVIEHRRNLGMGGALKTGFARALRCPGVSGVVAADADGQHLVSDIRAVAMTLQQHPGCVVLGTRSLQEAPLHRRWGNAILNGLFFALAGKAVSDTQTGLRGWPISVVRRLVNLSRNGFDFQMSCLMAIQDEPIWQVPIRTVYPEGTERSHVKLWDFFKIIGVMLHETSVPVRSRGAAGASAVGWNVRGV
jgi:glycosyltransferase involved in cell wall biosynthesis